MKNILLLLLFFSSLFVNAQDYKPVSNGPVIQHTYYSLAYNEQHEQAEWVYYKLTPEMINGSAQRNDNFREDIKVKTKSAQLSDYRGSGYDRGHLAPAASMAINSTAMSESFLLSNMSPQHPSFNRGAWKNLESAVRKWALKKGVIYIATGGIFTDIITTIGSNEVSVPGHYYKVLYSPKDNEMIGFVMPNKGIEEPIEHYIKTVDYVEGLTGIDFFASLDDSIEKEIEGRVNKSSWTINTYGNTKAKNANSTQVIGASVQCKATAKSTGMRCKNKTKNPTSLCNIHQPQGK